MNLKQAVAELRKLGRALVRELGVVDSAASPRGVSLSQCHILVEIDRPENLTAKDLSDRLLVDKAAISRSIAQLCESGYLIPCNDLLDKRRRPLKLTATGQKKAMQIHQSANTRIQDALTLLTADEREKVIAGVSLYVSALNKARVHKEGL